MGCFRNIFGAERLAFAFAAVCVLAFFAGCSNTSSTDSAGILIETNTGNKGLARILVSTENLDVVAGDTVVVFKASADTVGDTLYVDTVDYRHVATSIECASGVMSLDSLPVGDYESVSVHPVDGAVRTVAVSWNVEEKSTNVDRALDAEFKGAVALVLPEGFVDLASSDEVFEDMPFAVRLPNVKNPCLLDADGNMVRLSRAELADVPTAKTSDSAVYWGVLPQVAFDGNGAISLDIVESCQSSDHIDLALARYVEHFDSIVPSEAALATGNELVSVLGNSRWVDSTDNWFYIPDFKPFSEDGYYMGLSIWFNIDSMQVGEYAQIISAKKDSVGFTLQKRGTSGAVNLRLDTRTGVYNTVVGRANGVLDGTWHNYSFKIHGDSVTTFIDGALLESRQFDSGEGFAAAFNPSIGYGGLRGGIDEVFFFDGTQSNNWMRLFYALQYAVIKE
ncbi:Concanavalin A-like lectin/glucanases superfamily protein [Fibrobacter sp. UWB15]|uniref:LamG-like jellyroll fold domain-containing protein n=1 Tax=unclassified Fibrobacter TaxID=2634177 RepID=UPI0009213AB9|nr:MULTISPECIES: LamG-like jellyroll fold domain-containing protein [unclassified Fibrobacter]PWJ62573.1 concanavalin A-like lectin/glucanase superfamily protein [Fibrobacter sp. UWB6]SHG48214.1 Concanavalin A-like lectin/glucanases superfamily protein [Fibrobacter sp. UWB8]SMG27607.1 Concanavalin A-like lectin/glucanases superfamily protein [Fibrobacter sp. UWB15]